MQKYNVKLTFTEPLLGTVAKDPEVYKSFVASKAADLNGVADELETVEKIEEKGWTGFHKLADGSPIIYDYILKGFFKDSCGMLRRVPKTHSSKVTSYKKVIDGLIFIEPRQIRLNLPDNANLGVIERPLRAQTAQGERVTLARSDTAPAGTTIEFQAIILGSIPDKLLIEWLDYGKYRGLGQWRNSGYGKFEYELAEAVP